MYPGGYLRLPHSRMGVWMADKIHVILGADLGMSQFHGTLTLHVKAFYKNATNFFNWACHGNVDSRIDEYQIGESTRKIPEDNPPPPRRLPPPRPLENLWKLPATNSYSWLYPIRANLLVISAHWNQCSPKYVVSCEKNVLLRRLSSFSQHVHTVGLNDVSLNFGGKTPQKLFWGRE